MTYPMCPLEASPESPGFSLSVPLSSLVREGLELVNNDITYNVN